MIQIGYDSEWFLSKAYPALNERKIKRRVNLAGVGGIHENDYQAIENLKEKRDTKRKQKNYGARNAPAEIKSINTMIRRLKANTLDYHHVNGDYSLPLKAHEKGNRIVYICSINPSHIGYLKDAITHGAHVILEKPAVIVMNTKGEADDSQLKELEDAINNCPHSIKLIDAEHYAHKKASTIFYSNLEEILANQKIKKVECALHEPDQSDKLRNIGLLNRSRSRTGLLTDTGVHLISFVSNLGANTNPIEGKVKYGMHPAYTVETSLNAEYEITNERNEYFTKDATISLDLEKFSNERIGLKPAQKKKKRVVFTLEDDSKVVLNLVTQRVFKISTDRKKVKFEIDKYDSNEYMNVMQDAYKTIIGEQTKARSDLRDTVKTMRAIYETYRVAPIIEEKNIERRY